eukprot:gnl/MRDRNA2_/MRDRNA2_147800_c0_seq1.p1 gnl/MRDRNA2_/MRDRNA2_147800_c0~~gnl/MRDRNA2_/MRDRNA2_147800_c0_seq1.p1  ORF type:complete len:359 (-),score=58.81 gnl/MRDRNA2_/MRDRNA2_147800_c0_seq1:54-1130(-)
MDSCGLKDDSNPVEIGSNGTSTLVVSRIGFGCMGITAFYGPPMQNDAVVDLLREVYALGYTHFDTAELYRSGPSGCPFDPPTQETVFNEIQVGRFLQTLPRDSFTVATKMIPELHGGGSCDLASVTEAVDASLERLGLEYIDLYYCHRMPKSIELLEAFMQSMKELVNSGKVKYVGLSEVSPTWLRRAHAVYPVTCVQMEWSLLTRNIEESLVPTCKELGIGIVAYSPLARNLLCHTSDVPKGFDRATNPRFSEENFQKNRILSSKIAAMAEKQGATSAQLSLAWLYQKAEDLGVKVVAIPGTTKAVHAKDNAKSLSISLSANDMRELEQYSGQVAGARGDEHYMALGFEALAETTPA